MFCLNLDEEKHEDKKEITLWYPVRGEPSQDPLIFSKTLSPDVLKVLVAKLFGFGDAVDLIY